MSGQDTLAKRYGAPAPWRRLATITASVALAMVFLVWLAWSVYEHSTPQVTSELETFSVEDEHTATAVLLVSLDNDDVQASCTLRAYAEDHTTVGELDLHPRPEQGAAPGADDPHRAARDVGRQRRLHGARPGPPQVSR